jgi:hypothetical protein
VPFLILSLVLAGALLSEQAPRPGIQGAAQGARISGRVVEDGTNAPLSGARVTAIAMARGPVVSPPGGPPPQAVTDQDGRFVFDGLPPGRYRIDVQKATFASPVSPPDPSALRTFQLAAGQALDGVNIPLLKGAVIAGQILDPSSGEPVVGTMVMAMRRLGVVGGPAGLVPSGTPRLVPAGQSAQTNDLGEFRIFGLPPGEYFVAASRPPNSDLAPTGGIAAVFSFYPGTPDASAAQPVTVAAGQVAAGFVMRLVTPQTYQVSGTVVDENGTPVARAMVMLRNDPRTSGYMPMPVGMGRSDAKGNFVISGVAPGSYQTMANVPSAVRSQNSAGGGIDALASRRILINGRRTSDQLDVTVTDANVEGVQIIVQLPQ